MLCLRIVNKQLLLLSNMFTINGDATQEELDIVEDIFDNNDHCRTT